MIQGNVSGVGDDNLYYTVSPTGGMIVLEPDSGADYGSWTLSRYLSVSGQSVSGVTLFQGASGQPKMSVWIDLGDGANQPLNTSSLYAYQFTTSNGTIETPPLSPACSLLIEQDHVNAILYRALQTGIGALTLPAGFTNAPEVTHAMPLAGAGVPRLPNISFNESLLQTQHFQIGEDVDYDDKANEFQVATQALRHYTIFIIASTVKEREYYKDAVVGIFSGLLQILNKIGNNISHRFQISSTQVTGRPMEPGFYVAEILLEFTGLYSVGVTTSYGSVSGFSFTFGESVA